MSSLSLRLFSSLCGPSAVGIGLLVAAMEHKERGTPSPVLINGEATDTDEHKTQGGGRLGCPFA